MEIQTIDVDAVPFHSKSEELQRDERMFLMHYRDGVTLSKIADHFGISRQRVEQRCQRYIVSLPVEQRRQATIQFLERYLKADTDLYCIRCKKPSPRDIVCSSCRKRLRALRHAKCMIRYVRSGHRGHLAQVIYHLRKNNIEPEDLCE